MRLYRGDPVYPKRNGRRGKNSSLPFRWMGVFAECYDSVEWLAKNPITNGKVGTLGSSALGITQLLWAPTAPPSLVCQYIGVAASSLYHQGIFPEGSCLKIKWKGG